MDGPPGPPAPEAETQSVPFEMYSREFQQMAMTEKYDGARIDVQKHVCGPTPAPGEQQGGPPQGLSIIHSLRLGCSDRRESASYSFGPMFSTRTGMMMCQYNTDGTVFGRMMQTLYGTPDGLSGPHGELRFMANTKQDDPQGNASEVEFTHSGTNKWNASLKVQYQGVFVTSATFSQRLFPWLHVGAEMQHIDIRGGGPAILSLAARYAKGQNAFVLNATSAPNLPMDPTQEQQSLKATFTRRVSERLMLGTELELAPSKDAGVNSGLKIACDYTFLTARVTNTIDTNGAITSTLMDARSNCGLCTQVDYNRGEYKFGVMMQLASQEAPQGGLPQQ